MQTIGTNQQLAAGYNLAPMFSYLMKTRNVELKPFEKSSQQQAFEQASSQWQQTVLQLVKQNPTMTPNQYPPQPKPADYGYTPGSLQTAPASVDKPSILEQVMAGINPTAATTNPTTQVQPSAQGAKQ